VGERSEKPEGEVRNVIILRRKELKSLHIFVGACMVARRASERTRAKCKELKIEREREK
jgi:hypothetical protein